ncbi:hypothetical protein CTI12_AA055670 [Artemisia annua]|uniref:Uncharacterized protein n=1 Tax=Artemisia annua TaxID=35608 RepID=A0A2U1QA66_ARTAN|nr:hypothetical protein CTI12_AA055670 [Artemisia annua]
MLLGSEVVELRFRFERALSITISLKVWGQGHSSLLFILGQAGIPNLLWKNMQTYSLVTITFRFGLPIKANSYNVHESTLGAKEVDATRKNPYEPFHDMAGVLLPFLKYFIGGSLSKGPKILNFVVRSPWNTLDIVGQENTYTLLLFDGLLSFCTQVKQPILFLSGQRDEMIPPLHMKMLYAKVAAHNKRCTFVEFPTGMHMDTWIAGGDHY